eukprot:747849-Hanusia_phi.AAC.4
MFMTECKLHVESHPVSSCLSPASSQRSPSPVLRSRNILAGPASAMSAITPLSPRGLPSPPHLQACAVIDDGRH